MSRHKPINYFGNFIALLVLAGVVWGVINFKGSSSYEAVRARIGGHFQEVQNFINARKHNINMEVNPPRKAPLSFLEREGKLKLWAADMFEPFGDEDWKFFWRLIYEQVSARAGKQMLKRYRTREEVEYLICENFPRFSYLKDMDWVELWSIAGVTW